MDDTATATQYDQVRVRILPDGRMDLDNAARYLGIARQTLYNWNSEGTGPKAALIGGRAYYFKADLDNFIATAAAKRQYRRKG